LTTGQLHQLIDQFQTGIIELHQVISTPKLEFSTDLSQQMSA
jgi:hypothetical protein